jgi:hypothetical protein
MSTGNEYFRMCYHFICRAICQNEERRLVPIDQLSSFSNSGRDFKSSTDLKNTEEKKIVIPTEDKNISTPFPQELYELYEQKTGDLWKRRSEDWGPVCGQEEKQWIIKDDGTYTNVQGQPKSILEKRPKFVTAGDFVAFPIYMKNDYGPYYVGKVVKSGNIRSCITTMGMTLVDLS